MKNLFKTYNSLVQKCVFLPQLLSRLVLGVVFIHSGYGKLTHLEKVIGFFQSLGIPAPQLQAPFVASVELICGALVLVGFFTRLAAAPLIGVMVVALITAKREDLSDINELFALSEFLYIILIGWIITVGAGPLSVDRWCCKKS